MIVYKDKLLKKSSNWKLTLILSTLVTRWPSNIAFHLLPIWLISNFGWIRFRIMPDIVSKLLRAAIWNHCTVLFKSEETLCPRTGCISFATPHHQMAFKYCISFATDLAANFGWNRFRIMPDIVSKLLRAAIWSHCTVLFKSEETVETPCPRTGCISFATDLASNFGCNWIMPDIVSKRLRAVIWSSCAVLFEFEQTPCPRVGCWLRSAAMHRIQFGTCCFVPMSYFYSETNEWLQDWVKQWALLWLATTSSRFHGNFNSNEEKNLSSLPDIYK